MQNDQSDFAAEHRTILLAGLEEYLAANRKSARWLGLRVCGDPRLVPNLKRGQHYPVAVIVALWERLFVFYGGAVTEEQALAKQCAGREPAIGETRPRHLEIVLGVATPVAA